MFRFLFAFASACAMTAPAHAAAPTRFSVVTVGEGPDVILIPGLSSPRAVWSKTAERLKTTHRVHLIQLKGFGEPAGPNASGPILQPFVDEIGVYIVDRKLKQPAVIGHSMGGLTAMMLAAQRPSLPGKVMVVDSLPFIGTLFGATNIEAIRPQATQMRTMLVGSAEKQSPTFATTECPANLPAPAKPQGTMSNSGEGNCLVRQGALASDLRVVGQAMYDVMVTDLRPRLKDITVPVTMLYPQDDRLLTAAAAAKTYQDAYAGLPSAKLLPVTGSYHFIMQDQPTQFEAALDAFLKR